MPVRSSFDYALVRVVPRVERGEFINAGVILFCRTRRFLRAGIELDRERLAVLAPGLDPDIVQRHLDLIPQVCEGNPEAGPIALLEQAERFHWLVAPRSTVIQPSPVHSGLCSDPGAMFEHLMEATIRAKPEKSKGDMMSELAHQTPFLPAAADEHMRHGYEDLVAGNYEAAQREWATAAQAAKAQAGVRSVGQSEPVLTPEQLAALAPAGYDALTIPADALAGGVQPGDPNALPAVPLAEFPSSLPRKSVDEHRHDLIDSAWAMQHQVKAGQLLGLEAFARLVDQAAAYYKGYPDPLTDFIDDVSAVILGRTGAGIYNQLQQPLQERYYLPGGLGGTGLRRAYQDPAGPNEDQMHHIWFYTHETVWDGFYFAMAANTYHEGAAGQPGRSLADWLLGIRGCELGALLKTGRFDIARVGDWMRKNLGPALGDV